MIGRVTGTLARKAPERVIVDVHGIGLEIHVSLNVFCRLPDAGEPVELLVHTHVREDAIQLYGFLDTTEKELFQLLIGVSGIGPRLAVNILSGRPVQELQEALGGGDVARLVAIPGVGKKTAERMLVELSDKVRAMRGTAEPERRATGVEAEAVSALVNLGYKRPQAERAVKQASANGAPDIETIIRNALQRVSA